MKPKVRCYTVGDCPDPEQMQELRGRLPGSIVQAVSGRVSSNEFFVEMIAAQTIRAAASDNLLAKKPEIDLLLRLASTTQISQALNDIGMKKGEPTLVVIAGDGKSVRNFKPSNDWTRLRRSELTDPEKQAIEDAALLVTQRG